MNADLDLTFPALGSAARLLLTDGPDAESASAAAQRARAWLARFDACASRFRPGSELCALNADPRPAVPASPLLRATVEAGLWAARRTGGLVEPVVIDALEACGYARSWEPNHALDLATALQAAPARRRPAAPDPAARWGSVRVDARGSAIVRPPGVRLDTGGTGKGLAADAIAHLVGNRRAVIDLGGDIALCRPPGDDEPFEIEVADPFTGATTHVLRVGGGGVATSGIDRRVWDTPAGPAHHLLDPATAAPAWSGLVSVTALAATALEAEVLAKAALLGGPRTAARWLAEHGGLVVDEAGAVELFGPLAPAPQKAAA
jgi:thiamine biosynthesis lipoprotein